MNKDENLKELAKDMTDEEVYEMARDIVNTVMYRRPVLKDMDYEPDDLLDEVFTYFYDKQSRGKESPLTLRYKITKDHLKNMLYREFNLAVSYRIRKPKNQKILNEISLTTSYQDYNTESNTDVLNLENHIQKMCDTTLLNIKDEYEEINNKDEQDRLLNCITDKTFDRILIKDDNISEIPVYKSFTYREFTKYILESNKEDLTSRKLHRNSRSNR